MGADNSVNGWGPSPDRSDDGKKPASLAEKALWTIDRPFSWLLGGAKSALDGSEFDPDASHSLQELRETVGKKVFGPDEGKWSSLSFGHNDGGKLTFDPPDLPDGDKPSDPWYGANDFGVSLSNGSGVLPKNVSKAFDYPIEVAGDIADTAIDMYVGSKLDPLNGLKWVFKGLDKVKEIKRYKDGVKLLKEGVDLKPGRNIYDGAVDTSIGSYFLDNSFSGRSKRAVTGGALGAGMASHEDSRSDDPVLNALTIGAGGLAGAGFGAYAPGVAKNAMGRFTDTMDEIAGRMAARASGNADLLDYPQQVQKARLGQKSVNMIAKHMENVRQSIMSPLLPKERISVERFLETSKEVEVHATNKSYMAMVKGLDPEKFAAFEAANANRFANVRQGSKEYFDIIREEYFGKSGRKANAVLWNKARQDAAVGVANDERVREYAQTLSPRAKQAYEQRVAANLQFIEQYNRIKGFDGVDVAVDAAAIKRMKGIGKDSKQYDYFDYKGKGDPDKLLGLKHHTDSVFMNVDPTPDELQALEQGRKSKFSGGFTKAYTGQRGDAVDEIAGELVATGQYSNYDDAYLAAKDITYDIYSRRTARKFLDDETSNAIGTVNEARQAIKQGSVIRATDELTAITKKNLLFNSVSWLKNNFYDNLEKSVMENGWGGFLDGVGVTDLKKGLMQDVRSLQDGVPLKEAMTGDKVWEYGAYGVVDVNSYQDIAGMTNAERGARFSPDVLKRMDEEIEPGRGVKMWRKMLEGGHKMTDWALPRAVADAGSYMEDRARILAYERFKAAVLKSEGMAALDQPEAFKQELAKIIASQNVQRTFFDYGGLSAGETEIVKRALPFYAFTKNNIPYWADKITDPTSLGKIAGFQRARTGGIAASDGDDEARMRNSYFSDSSPRLLRKGDESSTYLTSPSSSFGDALQTILSPGQAAMDVVQNPQRLFSDVIGSNENPVLNLMHPLVKKAGEQMFGVSSFFEAPLNPEKSASGRVPLGKAGYPGALVGDLLGKMGIDRNWALPVGGYRNAATNGSGPQTDAEFTSRLVNGLTGMPPVLYGKAAPFSVLGMPIAQDAAKIGHSLVNPEKYSILENLVDIFSPVRMTTVDEDRAAIGAAAKRFDDAKKKKQKIINDRRLKQDNPTLKPPGPVKGWDY